MIVPKVCVYFQYYLQLFLHVLYNSYAGNGMQHTSIIVELCTCIMHLSMFYHFTYYLTTVGQHVAKWVINEFSNQSIINQFKSVSFLYSWIVWLAPQYREVATAIVQHSSWKQMMGMSKTEETTKDTKIVTPMRMLIEFMPGTINKQTLLTCTCMCTCIFHLHVVWYMYVQHKTFFSYKRFVYIYS